MNNQPNRPVESEMPLDRLAAEFLEVLIDEQTPYPWNLEEAESETYFSELEENFSLLDGLDPQEVEAQARKFFSHLQARWNCQAGVRVKHSLLERFGKLVPAGWLESITEQSQQAIAANASLLEQVVECVQPLLSNWTQEDLLLLARPYTLALRDSSAKEHTPWEHMPWEELSEIDRIRLTIVVAREALTQLQSE